MDRLEKYRQLQCGDTSSHEMGSNVLPGVSYLNQQSEKMPLVRFRRQVAFNSLPGAQIEKDVGIARQLSTPRKALGFAPDTTSTR